jgi:hypothetical protein
MLLLGGMKLNQFLCIGFRLYCLAAMVSGSAQTEPLPNNQPRLELTAVDVFSRHDWTGAQISVWGIYLGMSRSSAIESVRNHGVRLVQDGVQTLTDDCSDAEYCNTWTFQKSGVYVGPTIRFDKAGGVVELVVRCLNYADPEIEKGSVTRKMKGQTYRFFNGKYTEELRTQFFGQESSTERVNGRWGDHPRDFKYIYPKKGVAITVAERPFSDSSPELVEMSFFTAAK